MNHGRDIVQVFAAAALVSPTATARADVYLTQDQALQVAIPGAERLEKKWLVLTADEQRKIEGKLGAGKAPRTFEYFVGYIGSNVVGFAKIDERIGKTMPITYVIGIDPSFKVRLVEIMAYRESHGGEVRQTDFRGQFLGKSAADTLRVGQDIRNISGATLSCRAIADGVRENLAILAMSLATATVPVGTDARKPAIPPPPVSGTPPNSRGDNGRIRRNRILMGTSLEIEVVAASDKLAFTAIEGVFEQVAFLEYALSTFIPESEVSRFNKCTGRRPFLVSAELSELVAKSTALSRRTGGAFDVTVQPLTRLWRDRLYCDGTEPMPVEILYAKAQTGIERLRLDHARSTLEKDGAEELNFGAIGKGFALDAGVRYLRRLGVTSALLNFGGQISALGSPPGRSGWPVAIATDPLTDGGTMIELSISNASIATSADDQGALSSAAGTAYSHIIDPRSGTPARGTKVASVIAASATDADALSTAIFVMGPTAGLKFASDNRLAAMIVGDDGKVRESASFSQARGVEVRG